MLTFGLTVALLGMSVVFTALLLLIFVIMLLSATARCITASITKKNIAAIAVPQAEDTLVCTETSSEDDDEELAVVLAAAVAAFGANKESFIPLRQEINTAHPAWFQAGCEEAVSLKSFSY